MSICKIYMGMLLFFSLLSTICKAQDILPGENDSLYNILKKIPRVIDLKSMSLEDALKKYPSPIRISNIDLMGPLGVGETILYSVFPEYAELKKRKRKYLKPLVVQEITWDLDTALNMTIWYKKDSLGTKPVLDRIWYKGTMF